MASTLDLHFPNLKDISSKRTSDPTPIYNCIAWAFKDLRRVWWPNERRAYWPLKPKAGATTMQCFEELFSSRGWQETVDSAFEDGFEKIALYAHNGVPTHASRLLPNGLWTSKLGQNIDLSHELFELEGPAYGNVVRYFKKIL